MNLYYLYAEKTHPKASVNQRLLKINIKTLDNAYLTVVYLHTIKNQVSK
ncbi:Uncharacterised protein [Flavobacterium hibernum]|nr:Uncharacterised protein [Flavobacterium hibernum]